MSIRAYKTITKFENNKIIKEIDTSEPIFNVWNESYIFDLIVNYGNDFTNDCGGFIEISIDDLLEMIKTETDKLKKEDIEKFNNLIKEYDDLNLDWIEFYCM